ncbi:hypothetical protein ACHAPI_009607 [Fusarium lateritium]
MSDSENYSEPDAVIIDRDDASNYNPDNILPKSTEEIKKIREWLEPTSYTVAGGEFRRHLASHAPGTGQWLTSTDEYQQWLRGDDECGLLWIKGIPGSGKSVHVAKLIDNLARENPDCPVLFFFFRQIIDANHNPQALLRDWMDQVLRYSPPLQHQLWKYIDDQVSLSSLSIGDLLKVLQMAFQALPDKVFCIADALDEMDDGNVAFLQAIGSLGQWRPHKVKVLISSRPVPKVELHLRQTPAFCIRLEERLVDCDISTYVRTELSESHIPESAWSAIESAVPGRANGLFLYARLAMEAFLESGAHIETVLAHLPLDLNVLYSELLQEHARRSGISSSVQRLILQSVTHATRPLRLLELAEMCRVVHPIGSGRDLRAMKDLIRTVCGPLLEVLPDETVSVVHHSFTEYLKGTTRGDEEGGYAVLRPGSSHSQLALSCLRYMLDTCCLDEVEITIDDSDKSRGYDDEKHCNYLNDYVYGEVLNLRIKFPFFAYAARNWHAHIRNSEASTYPQDDINQVLEQFLGSDKHLKAWLEVSWPGTSSNARKFLALHVAARYGLVAYTRKLAATWPGGVDVSDIIGRRPLWWASSEGHAATVGELIAAGANPNHLDFMTGERPLQVAAKKNHGATVKVLLEAGVESLVSASPTEEEKAKEFSGGINKEPAYRSACEGGHEEAVAAFIPFLDLEAKQQCFTWAAQLGQARVVAQMLSQPGIDVDALQYGNTTLFKACLQRDLTTVKVLLDGGADPKLLNEYWQQSSDWWKPRVVERPDGSYPQYSCLHALCGSVESLPANHEWNHEDTCTIAQLLIDAGVNPDCPTGDGTTALHSAAGVSYFLTRFLIESGASVQVVNSKGQTPLHVCQVESCIPLLVESGVDVNARDWYGNTPLLAVVSKHRNSSIAMLLLEHGADAGVLNSIGQSALDLALKSYDAEPVRLPPLPVFQPLFGDGLSEKQDIIEMLIGGGADPNKRNHCDETPLMLANRSAQFKSICDLLLAAGADINSRDRAGRTILWRQVGTMPKVEDDGQESHDDIQFLLDHGADPNVRDFRGRTLLHESIKQRPASFHSRTGEDDTRIPRLDFLLNLGLDYTVVDYNGNSLLHEFAARESSTYPYTRDWVMILWERLVCTLGLDADQKNHMGRTPLHILCDAYSRPGEFRPSSKPEPIDFLIKHMKDLDVSDHTGQTALHIAATRSEYCTKKLLDAGSSPFTITHKGLTPLHVASHAQQSNIVGLLVHFLRESSLNRSRASSNTSDNEGEADDILHIDGIDGRDEKGLSSLYYAVRSGRPESVQILLEAGAKINTGGDLFKACSRFEDENASRAATKHVKHDPLTQREAKEDDLGPCEGSSPSTPDKPKVSVIETSRLEEIVVMLVEYGADVSLLKDGLILKCLWRGKAYTASCLFDRVPLSLWAEPSRSTTHTVLLSTYAPVYDSSVSSKYTMPVVVGKPNRIQFELFIRQRRYYLLKELAKRGTRFLPNPNDAWHFSDFSTLVRLGFTKLVRTIGLIEAERALGQGDWHAFGDSSKAGLWCANRPADEETAEGRDMRYTDRSDEQSIPKPFLLEAVECELPNLDIVKLLVETFHVDVNERTWGTLYTNGGTHLGYNDSALHSVAEGFHWWHVHQALEYLLKVPGIDINLRVEGGLTPLHWAIAGRDSDRQLRHRPYACDAMKRLLEAGADVHLKTKRGESCLSLAACNVEMVRLLIEHGAIIEPDDVVAAVESGQIDVLCELLQAKEKDGQDSALNLDSPLRAAGSLFRKPDPEDGYYTPLVDDLIVVEMIEILIIHGANPLSNYFVRDKRDDSFPPSEYIHFKSGMPPSDIKPDDVEKTILHSLITGIGNLKIEPFLVPGIDINYRDPNGRTLLHALCCSGDLVSKPVTEGGQETIFHHFVALGADLTTKDNSGRTVLISLLNSWSTDSAKWRAILHDVIRLAPELIHEADDILGDTPLMHAIRRSVESKGDTETIEWLLSAGASPLVINKSGRGVLHELAKDLGTGALRQLFRDLVGCGADINSRDWQGQTPLFNFAKRNLQDSDADYHKRKVRGDLYEDPREQEAIPMLRELGADFFAKDDTGRGLLHIAATCDAVRFQELMSVGLDPMMENDAQQTAIDVAAAYSNDSILEIFEKEAKR